MQMQPIEKSYFADNLFLLIHFDCYKDLGECIRLSAFSNGSDFT